MKKILLLVSVIMIFLSGNEFDNKISDGLEGEVVKCYKKIHNNGEIKNEWFFIDLKVNDKIYHIAVIPAAKISNIPIKKGDEIKVKVLKEDTDTNCHVFNAVYIYDLTQQKKYTLAKYCFWGGFGKRKYCSVYE